MNYDDVMRYEVAGSRWCARFRWRWWREAWAHYLARKVGRRFARYERLYPERAQQAQAGTAQPPADAPAWRLLPGHVLELGATGFSIHLSHDRSRMPYALHDPEGRLAGWGGDLQGLKRAAEGLARDRKEFQR